MKFPYYLLFFILLVCQQTQTQVYFKTEYISSTSYKNGENKFPGATGDLKVIQGDVNNVKIPPLLFIPFVENAIKHNPDSENLSYIYLYFCVKHDKLIFTCENSKPLMPVKKAED